MGTINTEIPADLHTALRNIKNNVDEAPDTIAGVFEWACTETADEHWPEWRD